MDDKIEVTLNYFGDLLDRSYMLYCLEVFNIKDWEHYEEALEKFNEEGM